MNRPTMMALTAAVLSATSLCSASAQSIALVGGDVYPGRGEMIAGGTVLIDLQRIRAVGPDVRIPRGAKVIDCRGKRVTPGFIDAVTQVGLVEVSQEPSTVDHTVGAPNPIRAAVQVQDAVNVRSTLVGVARRQGVTSVVSAPRGGLISGRSAWVDLLAPDSAYIEDAVRGPIALHAVLGEGGARAVMGSRAAAFARLRETFDDARVYREKRTAFRRRDLYALSASRLDLKAIEPVLIQRAPLVVQAHRASDISAILRFAREERVQVAIYGAAEGWMVADALAVARVPVIVDPFGNLPTSFEARHARTDNAALMAEAGVKLAFTAERTHNVGGLRFSAGHAVRTGVPADVALAATTAVPAEIYGQPYGALQRGLYANVVVWSGDPFEPSSYAETVIIRGEIQPTASRQIELARRYMTRLGLGPDAMKNPK